MATTNRLERAVWRAPLTRAGIAGGLLLLATVVYAGVAYSQSAESSALIAASCAVLALGALLALAWSAARGDFGSAVAWGYTALPLIALILLLALPLTHPLSFFPDQCMQNAGGLDCDPAPPGAWAPLVLLTLCFVATWAAIRRSKAARRAMETPAPEPPSADPRS